jgi:polysaccharide pyruvyl transferase WcaK-like protein
VILGGGDVVAPFFLDWIPDTVKFAMVGVGLKYEQASIQALKAKGGALDFAWYRNQIDVELCRAADMKCEYIPDIVFAMRHYHASVPDHILKMVRPENGKPTALVCLADHFNSRVSINHPSSTAYLEYFKWELARSLDELADYCNIVFYPLSVYANHQDARFHYDVARRMKNRKYVREIREDLHPGVGISLMREVEHVISMKLHGNIYGLLTERACVNIGVGRKQTKLYEEANLHDVSVEPYGFTRDAFFRCFDASKTPAMRRRVSDLAEKNYNRLVRFRTKLRRYVGLDAAPLLANEFFKTPANGEADGEAA